MGRLATSDDQDTVKTLLRSVGEVYTVDEKMISAVTGLSGSGPAYVFMMIDALIDGGIQAGLPEPIARQLAAQTVLGSAKMVIETGTHPGELCDNVASPQGTTVAGINALHKAGMRAGFIAAVRAATERANELSRT